MMATHAFDTFNDNGTPTAATVIVGGRSAATFVVVARVSLAFISGGRTAVHGRHRTAGAAGVAVRAVLVGMIGLALGFTQLDRLNVILPWRGALADTGACSARLLRPVAVAGSMTLTLYCAHVLVLWTGVLRGDLMLLYVWMDVGATRLRPAVAALVPDRAP